MLPTASLADPEVPAGSTPPFAEDSKADAELALRMLRAELHTTNNVLEKEIYRLRDVMREALKPGGSPAAYKNLQLEALKREPPSVLYAKHSLTALALLKAAEGERPLMQQGPPSAQGTPQSRAETMRAQAAPHPAMPSHYPLGGDPAEAVSVLAAARGGGVLLQSTSPHPSAPNKRPWSSSRYRVGYGEPTQLMPGGVMEVPRWEYHCRSE